MVFTAVWGCVYEGIVPCQKEVYEESGGIRRRVRDADLVAIIPMAVFPTVVFLDEN